MAKSCITPIPEDRVSVVSIAANTTYTFTFDPSEGFLLLFNGISARRGIYFGYCGSTGSVAVTDIATTSVVTLDTSVSYKLKVTATAAVVVTYIKTT